MDDKVLWSLGNDPERLSQNTGSFCFFLMSQEESVRPTSQGQPKRQGRLDGVKISPSGSATCPENCALVFKKIALSEPTDQINKNQAGERKHQSTEIGKAKAVQEIKPLVTHAQMGREGIHQIPHIAKVTRQLRKKMEKSPGSQCLKTWQ